MATLYIQNCSPAPPPPTSLKPYFFHGPLKSQQPHYLIKNECLIGINKTCIRSIPVYCSLLHSRFCVVITALRDDTKNGCVADYVYCKINDLIY